MHRLHVFRTLSRHPSDCILLGHPGLFPGTRRIASSSTECYFVALCFPYSTIHHTIFTVIYFCLHSPTSPSSNMEPTANQVRNHNSTKNQEAHLERALHVHWSGQPIFMANQMFELPTQPLSRVMEIANVQAIIVLIKQDDDDSDREISEDESNDVGEPTFSSVIEEYDLGDRREVLDPNLVRCDKTLRTTRVPLPKKCRHADTVIAGTWLPNLRHPAGAIAPPWLKCRKSTINILCESDVIPPHALPLPEAGGDQNVPQPKASGYHNVPQHQKATVEVAKQYMAAIVFPKTPWSITSDEKYSMVKKEWKLAIEAQDRQRALAGAPIGSPSVCQLPGGPSLKIDLQTREAVSVYSVFCSPIGLMMITPDIYIVKTRD